MNDFLRGRYKKEDVFIGNKNKLIPKDLGNNRVVFSGGNEYLIVGETDTYYRCYNPHIDVKCRIKKYGQPTYPRHDDHILRDVYIYGVLWRKSLGYKIFTILDCIEKLSGN